MGLLCLFQKKNMKIENLDFIDENHKQKLLSDSQTKNGITGNTLISLRELFSNGYCRTGKSYFKSRSPYKHVWTSKVILVLEILGIQFESGNDAPRGGANGEYVKLLNLKK